MLKSTTALAALGILTLAGAAFAGDHHRARAVQASAPQPIMAVVEAGSGTITGTVGTVAATWLVVNDGEKDIPVTSRGFLPEGIKSGERITVVGSMRRGAIQASQIIREDGSAFGRGISWDRRDRDHDDDDD